MITKVAEPARTRGDDVYILPSESALRDTCRSTLRSVSSCIAAAVFYSSPSDGPGGRWNYTIKADGELGSRIDVHTNSNSEEIYLLRFQHSIDWAIAQINVTVDHSALPNEVCFHKLTNLMQSANSCSDNGIPLYIIDSGTT